MPCRLDRHLPAKLVYMPAQRWLQVDYTGFATTSKIGGEPILRGGIDR
ncbi:MAG TPA: hypothetical protein VK456_10510 [Xanthobacteraceae bacterium]|nr:hypothetical protein [Xanthobacteraceae bacterium]